MRLERKVNIGGFQSMAFASSDHNTVQECARDLVAQMQPMASVYPTIGSALSEIKKAYAV